MLPDRRWGEGGGEKQAQSARSANKITCVLDCASTFIVAPQIKREETISRIKFLIKCHLYLSASSETEYQILNQSMFACFTYYGNVKIRAKPYSFRKARSIDRKLENKKCMSTLVTTFYLTFSWKFYGTQLSQSNWRHKD